MINKKIMLGVLVLLLALPIAAQATDYFKQGTTSDVTYPCFNSTQQLCETDVNCTISIYYPNSTVFIYNKPMTNQTSYYNYTIDYTNMNVTGLYKTVVSCTDGTESGYAVSLMGITFNGLEPPGSSVIIFFIIAFIAIIAIILYTLIHVLVRFKTLEIDPYDIVYCFMSYFALFIIFAMNNLYMGSEMINDLLTILIVAFGFTHIFLPMLLFVIAWFKQLADIKFRNQQGGNY
jgi:hypothetical protein